MKAYILVKKPSEDYSSISADFEKLFIFDSVQSDNPDYDYYWNKLDLILRDSDPEKDKIIFNGPAFLIAIAGYIWFSQSERNKYNTLTYSRVDGKYLDCTVALPS